MYATFCFSYIYWNILVNLLTYAERHVSRNNFGNEIYGTLTSSKVQLTKLAVGIYGQPFAVNSSEKDSQTFLLNNDKCGK